MMDKTTVSWICSRCLKKGGKKVRVYINNYPYPVMETIRAAMASFILEV